MRKIIGGFWNTYEKSHTKKYSPVQDSSIFNKIKNRYTEVKESD